MYDLRRRDRAATDAAIIQSIPDLDGKDTDVFVRKVDRYINAARLCKDMGILPMWRRNYDAVEWVPPERLVAFASTVSDDWAGRLCHMYKITTDNNNNKQFGKRSRKRDLRLRQRHLQTKQAVYGAMIGDNRLKIGFTALGVNSRLLDLERKCKIEPIVVFIYKADNPHMLEKQLFKNEFLRSRKVEYLGIKNEVFSVSWKEAKRIKHLVRGLSLNK
jgi:hypothetical protein